MENNKNWAASFLDELSKSAAWWPGKLLGRKSPKTGLNRKDTKAKVKSDAAAKVKSDADKADTATAKKNLSSNVKKRDEGRKSKDYVATSAAQNRINKAKGSKVVHTEASAKKQHAEQTSYSAAKKKSGGTLAADIKARKKHKKGSAEYSAIQNRINKAYGSKKVHKAPVKPKVDKNPKKDLTKKSNLKFFGNVD